MTELRFITEQFQPTKAFNHTKIALETISDGPKIQNFPGGGMPPDPPSRRTSRALRAPHTFSRIGLPSSITHLTKGKLLPTALQSNTLDVM